MVMVMNLYSTFSIFIFKCALQASDLCVRSDINIYRRRWQPLISPLAILPSTLTNETKPDYNAGNYHSALLLATSVWVLLRPTGLCEQWRTVKGCETNLVPRAFPLKVGGAETGPTVYPYPRRLESLTICGCNYKGSTFSSK